MGMKATGLAGLANDFRRIADAAVTAAAPVLHAQGEAISARSRALAPIDEGNLEASHDVTTERAGGQVRTTVSVGGIVNGVDVDGYAVRMHEGDYNLGPLSRAKAEATGQPVGQKFLERAFIEQEGKVADAIADALAKVIR